MKKLLLMLVLLIITSLAFTQTGKNKKSNAKATYTCSMHPEVVSNKPGKCPKCGMALVKQSAATTYVCPMHPDQTSNKPGKCPKCGMNMVKQTSKKK